jgi:hypothetical protein
MTLQITANPKRQSALGITANTRRSASVGSRPHWDNIVGAPSITAFSETVLNQASSNEWLATLTATRSETGATAVPLLTKFRETINPIDFGVVRGGGSATTNDAAIAYAIAAAVSTGRPIEFPGGVFDFSVPIALSVGVSMFGQRGDTTLRTTSATADLIDAAGFNVIDGFNFQSTVTRSGGYWVDIAGAEVLIDHFRASGTHGGFLIRDGAGSFRIVNGHMSSFAAGGYTVMVGEGGGSAPQVGYITDNIFAATVTGRPAAHIRLHNADSINMRGNQIIGATYNLIADPSNGLSVVSIKSEGDWFDQGAAYNIRLAPSGTGAIARCSFFNSWAAQGVTDNISLEASGTNSINAVEFIGVENYDSAGDGFDINGATVTKIDITGGRHAENAGSGVKITDATGVTITGARIGPAGGFGANAVGLTFAGAADDIVVSGCDLQGNTSVLSNTSSGTDLIIRSCLPLANNTTISVAELSALFAAANIWTGLQKFTNIQTDFEYSDDGAAGGPNVNYVRLSTTPAASDILGQFSFWGKDGAGTTVVYGRVRATVLDTSAGLHDGKWELMATINGTVTSILTIGPDVVASTKLSSSSATGGVGYSTGAGGTQTQGTSKSTAVTLDKVCGTITTHNANLGAGTIVSFVLNNSAIAATDQLLVTHESGGTLGAYTVNGRATGAGTAAIDIRNNTGGILGEALVLRFSVIKGVSA